MKGGAMRCEIDSIKNILRTNDSDHLDVFVDKLCSLSKKDVQSLVTDLVFEADLGKYIKMVRNQGFFGTRNCTRDKRKRFFLNVNTLLYYYVYCLI